MESLNITHNDAPHVRISARRDDEIVHDGFDGYLKIACSVAWRWYRFAFQEREERHQAAALAACVALNELGPNSTLNQVGRRIQKALYLEAKAQGWKLETYRRADTGRKSSHWIKLERTYGGDWDTRITNQEGRF